MSLANYSNMNSVSIANSLGSGSRAPILIPEEYNSVVGRMILHLNTINEDIWKCVEGTYITPENMATLATNQATQTDIIRKLELQAKKELVSRIPHSILSQMDDIMLLTANQIWENLKNRFCGNKRIIRNKRTSVLNEYNNFKMLSSETIHDAHDRFNLIMVKMNNLAKKWLNSVFREIQLFIQKLCMYGEPQLYESLIDPLTTTAFGGPLALVSTTSQNQIPFNDQKFNRFNQATSFQNQTLQSDSNDEADYQQLCALVANTNIQRFLPNHGQSNLRPNFQNRPSFGQNNSDHPLDKITQVFNQDHPLDKKTQVFNQDPTLDKILKDLLSIITQTKVFKIRDFKMIPTHVIITIQTTVFKIKTEVSKIKVTTIKTMAFKTTKILDSNKTILSLPNKTKPKHLKDFRLRVKRMKEQITMPENVEPKTKPKSKTRHTMLKEPMN
uniref:Uncharacterized protein n=1 Tax=Lactuca sativa TaxID=4236 RepID=A0A9R1XTT3_LACSA|nr:hypothetical protein LSAT_V11C300147350 [Lactuca sativa]